MRLPAIAVVLDAATDGSMGIIKVGVAHCRRQLGLAALCLGFRAFYHCLGGGLAQVLGLLGQRLHLRLDEFLLQPGEVLGCPSFAPAFVNSKALPTLRSAEPRILLLSSEPPMTLPGMWR